MSVELVLDIAELVLDTELESADADRLGPVVARAVERLAARLATRPPSDLHALSRLELGTIELSPDELDRALAPGGADHLADVLLRNLLAHGEAD